MNAAVPASRAEPLHEPEDPQARARGELRPWFGRAVLELLPDLTAMARRFTRNQADAEDLVADTVARAWMQLPHLNDRARFRGWIFRILTNGWISEYRKRQSRPVHEPLPEEDDCFSLFERLHQPFLLWWGNSEREFLNDLLREDLERSVDGLPEEFRAAVVLADVHGFTYAEIAGMLDVPIGTVRSRLARGRARLQRALWEHARERGWRDADPETTEEGGP